MNVSHEAVSHLSVLRGLNERLPWPALREIFLAVHVVRKQLNLRRFPNDTNHTYGFHGWYHESGCGNASLCCVQLRLICPDDKEDTTPAGVLTDLKTCTIWSHSAESLQTPRLVPFGVTSLGPHRPQDLHHLDRHLAGSSQTPPDLHHLESSRWVLTDLKIYTIWSYFAESSQTLRFKPFGQSHRSVLTNPKTYTIWSYLAGSSQTPRFTPFRVTSQSPHRP
jgi:hypothetical protein